MAVVVCDLGERVSTVPARLAGLGLQVEWFALATGDYAIGRTVLVERKSVLDLNVAAIDNGVRVLRAGIRRTRHRGSSVSPCPRSPRGSRTRCSRTSAT